MAAFFAISRRRLAVIPSARALPPMRPSHGGGILAVVRSQVLDLASAILATMTALPMASAGRFLTLGASWHIIVPLTAYR